nr:hypothetical protein [Enterococcus sp. DIV0212c]
MLVSPDQYHAEEERVLQGIKMSTEEYSQAKQLLPEGYTFVGDSSDYSIRASRPVLLARDYIQKYGWSGYYSTDDYIRFYWVRFAS